MHDQTRYTKYLLPIVFLLSGSLIGQNTPINLDHPVNDFIFRYHTKGNVKTIHPGLRPFSVDQVIKALEEISNVNLSISEREMLRYFKKEFDVKKLSDGMKGPWQRNQLKYATKAVFSDYNLDNNEIRFLSYKDKELTFWTDWEEWFSVDIQDTIQRLFYNDRVTISGQFNNNLSFFSRYSLYRVEHKDSFPIPKEFKQGYILLEENTDWLVWDVSEASLRFDHSIMNAEISKIPIYWGYSKRHSPIFISQCSIIFISQIFERL